MAKIEGPNVIEAEDVVYMTMRDQNRVKMAYIGPQGLLSKIYGGVNQNLLVPMLDQDRYPKPLVTRIIG